MQAKISLVQMLPGSCYLFGIVFQLDETVDDCECWEGSIRRGRRVLQACSELVHAGGGKMVQVGNYLYWPC